MTERQETESRFAAVKCALGIHDWRVLSASPWGHSTWHKWQVRSECRRCGEYSAYMETNERLVPEEDDD